MTEGEHRFIDKSPTLHGPLYLLLRRYVCILFIFGYRVDIRKCYLILDHLNWKGCHNYQRFHFYCERLSKTIRSIDSYIKDIKFSSHEAFLE